MFGVAVDDDDVDVVCRLTFWLLPILVMVVVTVVFGTFVQLVRLKLLLFELELLEIEDSHPPLP